MYKEVDSLLKRNKFKLHKPKFFMEEGYDYSAQYSNNAFAKIHDIEEKQRILKDRMLLIGQNLIETKEEVNEKLLEMKKEIQILKQNTERLISFIETASSEFSKFARKEDVEILAKQLRMLKPFIKK